MRMVIALLMALSSTAAMAKKSCGANEHMLALKAPNGTTVSGCANAKNEFVAMVVIRDQHGKEIGEGELLNGHANGVWKVWEKGKIVHPLFHDGKVIVADYREHEDEGGSDSD